MSASHEACGLQDPWQMSVRIVFVVLDFGFGFARAVNIVVGFLFVSTTVFAYVIDMAALGGQKCNYTLGGTQQFVSGFPWPLACRGGYRPSRTFFSFADSNQEVKGCRRTIFL